MFCVFWHGFSQYAYCTIVSLTPPKEEPHGKPTDLPMANGLPFCGFGNRTQLHVRGVDVPAHDLSLDQRCGGTSSINPHIIRCIRNLGRAPAKATQNKFGSQRADLVPYQ
jgi:hypothetical protein